MKIQQNLLMASFALSVAVCAVAAPARAQDVELRQDAPPAPTTTPMTSGKSINCPNLPQNFDRLYGALIKNGFTAQEEPLYEGYDYDPFDGTQYDDIEWADGDKYRMREVIEDVMDSGDVFYQKFDMPTGPVYKIMHDDADSAPTDTLQVSRDIKEFQNKLDRPNKPQVLPGSTQLRISVRAPKWTPNLPDLPDFISEVKVVRIYLKRFKLKETPGDVIDVADPGLGDVDDSHDNPTPSGKGKLHLRRKTLLAVGTPAKVLGGIYNDKTPNTGRKYWYVLEAIYEVTPKEGRVFHLAVASKPEKWVAKQQ